VRKFYVIVVISLVGFTLHAQTNSTATNAAPRVTHIDSDSADFDLNARTAIYRGDVHVTDPDMNLTCAYLIADLPEAGHINHIVAKTNVVIDFSDAKGETRHATGDKAVYDYAVKNGATNETVTLTGNPQVTDAQKNVMTADVIVWDRIENRFHFRNPHAIIQNPESLTETNSAPDTNQLPQLKTNLPGTIDNIDKVLPTPQNAP